jgi:hypothetical protein
MPRLVGKDNLAGTNMFMEYQSCGHYRLLDLDPVRYWYPDTALSLA